MTSDLMLLPNLFFFTKDATLPFAIKRQLIFLPTNPYELTKKELRLFLSLFFFLNNGISYPAYGYFVNNKWFENPKGEELHMKYYSTKQALYSSLLQF